MASLPSDSVRPQPSPPGAPDLEKAPVADVLQRLAVAPAQGLSAAEAAKRLGQYGPNAIVQKETSLLTKVLRYFRGPIAVMIEAAAVVSAILGHWQDFVIIAALLVFNAALDLWQDRKASNALAALKKGLAPQATVLRDGAWSTVDAANLVPGDIVKIRLGAIVPADLRLVEGDFASIDQSALTGESLPVAKKVGDEAYSGSVVKQGEMTGVVIATGGTTFFGRTAKLVAGAGVGQPRAAGDVRDRQLPDRARARARGGDGRGAGLARHRRRRRLALGRRALDPAVRADPARRLDPGGDAGGVLDHHGARRAGALEAEGDRLAARGDRGDGRGRHPVHRQDRHADQERAQARRPDPVRRQGLRRTWCSPARWPRGSRTTTRSTPA